jgi:hypothetical protein
MSSSRATPTLGRDKLHACNCWWAPSLPCSRRPPLSSLVPVPEWGDVPGWLQAAGEAGALYLAVRGRRQHKQSTGRAPSRSCRPLRGGAAPPHRGQPRHRRDRRPGMGSRRRDRQRRQAPSCSTRPSPPSTGLASSSSHPRSSAVPPGSGTSAATRTGSSPSSRRLARSSRPAEAPPTRVRAQSSSLQPYVQRVRPEDRGSTCGCYRNRPSIRARPRSAVPPPERPGR